MIAKLSQYQPDAEVRVLLPTKGLFVDDVVGLMDLKDYEYRTRGFNSVRQRRDYFKRLEKFLVDEHRLFNEGAVYLRTYLY